MEQFEAQVAKCQKEIAVLKDRIRELEEQLARSSNSKDSQLQDLEQELSKYRKELAARDDVISDLDDQLAQYTKQIAAQQELLSEINDQLAQCLEQAAAQKSQLDNVELQCGEQEQRISDLTAKLGELETLREAHAEGLSKFQAQMAGVENNPNVANLEGAFH